MGKDRSQFTSPPGPAEPEVKGGISVLRCGSEQPVFNMQEALGSVLNNTPTPKEKKKNLIARNKCRTGLGGTPSIPPGQTGQEGQAILFGLISLYLLSLLGSHIGSQHLCFDIMEVRGL